MGKTTTQLQGTTLHTPREEGQLPETTGFVLAHGRERETELAMNGGEKDLKPPRQARDRPPGITMPGTGEATLSGMRGLIKEIGKLPPYHATLAAIAVVAFAIAVVVIKG